MSPEESNQEERRVKSDDTYPSLDTGQQPEELYDQGLNVEEPNAGNAVTGYDASKDQRLNGS